MGGEHLFSNFPTRKSVLQMYNPQSSVDWEHMAQGVSSTAGITSLSRWYANDLNIAIIRVGMALVILNHSLARFGIGPRVGDRVITVGTFGGFLGQMGIPAPGVMAWVVTLVEVVGSLFLLLGVLVRVSSALIAVDMFMANYLVHWPAGWAEQAWQIELTVLLILLSLSLIVSGPGKLSVDRMLFENSLSTEGWIRRRVGRT